MRIWQTTGQPQTQLQILQFGSETVGRKAHWGPGRRNFWILHYVLEGKGFFNGAPVEKGQGFLIHPMKSVEYHPDMKEPWQYFWVSFDGAEAEEICKKHIFTDSNGVFAYDFRAELTQLLASLLTKEKIIGQMLALSVFYRLMSYHESHLHPAQNRYVSEAVSMIHLNHHRQLRIEEVASACGIDDRYLYNLFVRHMGISPKQYLNRVRLQNAKQLLKDSSCTVTEAAISVGFEDVLAFSRFFTKHVGMSPTAYRKQWSPN